MIIKKRREVDEINSSSMADIAFLLLVFFLVTTTISMDKGISLILPAEGNELEVNKKNIVEILVNQTGKVLMGDSPVLIKNIQSKAQKLMDGNPNLIFSVQTTNETKYNSYIKVLDQLKLAGASKISIANPPGN